MNSEETRNLRELVVKNWKINKFAYLMVDERGEYPFFEKLKLKIKLNEIPNSSFDKSKHVDLKEQEALCALIQGYLATGTDEGGLKALDAHLKGKVSNDKQDKVPNTHTNITLTKQKRHKSNPELHKIFWRAFEHLRDNDELSVEPHYKKVWKAIYDDFAKSKEKETHAEHRQFDPKEHIENIDPVGLPQNTKLFWIIATAGGDVYSQGDYALVSLPSLLNKLKNNPPRL